MRARSTSDTAEKVALGVLALWGLSRLLDGGGDGGSALAFGGDGAKAKAKAKAKKSDTRDELAELPDELDVETSAKLAAGPKGKGGATPVVIDVYGPAIREATPAERAAAKKPPKKPAKPAGTVSASPELEPHHGPTLPAGYNPVLARARAPVIAAHLAAKGPKAYSHALLKEWQTLAAIRADGLYAGSSRGALVFYGVGNPPRPFGAPYATLPYHPPDMSP
jgi:hypothetical protein